MRLRETVVKKIGDMGPLEVMTKCQVNFYALIGPATLSTPKALAQYMFHGH